MRNQRVEASSTPASIYYLPRDLILDQKEFGPKFNISMIINGNAIDGKKIFIGIWHMKDIV
jgi:hypothetical protein